MKKVLISVLVSSLLVGAMIAKPKAKVETPVPEPVPEMTIKEWFEQARTITSPGVFYGLVSDYVLYDLADSYLVTVDGVGIQRPIYHHLWFVGMDTQDAWNKSIWGPFEVDVTPYKKEVRGCLTKDDFIKDFLDRSTSDNIVTLNTKSSSLIKPSYVKALPTLEGKGSSYDFAWVFPDGYFIFTAGAYNDSEGVWMKPKARYDNAQASNTFFFYDYNMLMTISFFSQYRSLYEERKGYQPQEFFDVLEARLKKEGTKEQLDNFYLIKDYLVAQYSAE